MSNPPRLDRSTAPGRSLLATALLRFDAAVERSRVADRRSEQLFEAWQQRWRSSRSRIEERLRSIDARLAVLEIEPTPPPRLGLLDVSDRFEDS